MNPIYIDFHIHTSENPNNLNQDYDIDCLLKRINEVSDNSDFLISLTDHNTINKSAYLKLIKKHKNVLLGVELHIEYSNDKKPYHCHIIFNINNITEKVIDKINEILNQLYPNKEITDSKKKIPHIEDIIREFDEYDFILLPHGGQSHSTFDKSIPDGVKFDTTIERSIYYNQFDGFTARSDEGLERTIEYFKRLGINDFVNLITCTDNYNPKKYPEAKSSDAKCFIPTWMLSQPTFSGLRLALSESSRLFRKTKPNEWSEYIEKVSLQNDKIDIEVNLTQGLNVVIGSSSSGKTLFVDSIHRKITNDFENTKYKNFLVEDISVLNPAGIVPHYINQNYIVELISDKSERGIDDIQIIKRVFPEDQEITDKVRQGLQRFKRDLNSLIDAVKKIEKLKEDLSHIPILTRLIVTDILRENIFKKIEPSDTLIDKCKYPKTDYEKHIDTLQEINDFLEKNAFVENDSNIIKKIKEKLDLAHDISVYERKIRDIFTKYKKALNKTLSKNNKEQRSKKNDFEKLIKKVSNYVVTMRKYEFALDSISKYSIECKTQENESKGHKLYIENQFKLSKEKFIEVLNTYLKKENIIECFEKLKPSTFFLHNFKQKPRIKNYEELESKIYTDFEKINKRSYRIVTSEGKKFESLSAGWKTSILLDLILGYSDDIAPLIIDQPEDNLATDYINFGLIKAIKDVKYKKQIILVSHNATIPMLGDAQNVIICQNNGKIRIRSNQLEGIIDRKSVVDYIAEITDGGKPSIKKRVKKYNLKSYKE
jgi:hypothetical protein